MHFQFLGTGSAFTMNNWQTNFLIRVNGRRLLVDCGGDIRHSLGEAGFTHRAINEVYISHQHADHIGGLEWLAFMSFFDKECPRPILHVTEDVGHRLWEKHLGNSIRYLVGRSADKGEFFDWDLIHVTREPNELWEGPADTFRFGHLTMTVVPVLHVPGEDGIREWGMEAFGLRIEGPEEPKVFWSSDLRFDAETMMPHYEWADHIIHDCETTMTDWAIGPRGVGGKTPTLSGVHPHFSELDTLPREIKEKMFLVHYQDNVLDEHGRVSEEWETHAYAAGFAGFIEPKSEIILSLPEEG